VTPEPTGSRIVLGVGGGIAAYKVAALLRLLTEAGHDVRVVPTRAALEFVGAATWSALSGHPVSSEVWDDVEDVPHVRIGQQADLVVVAPATADLLARAAHGLADDLLTNTLLTARCPVLMVPAMHTEMWLHQATQDNVATLRRRGVDVLDPASGRLTGADTGPGRLPEPAEIFEAATRLLAGRSVAPDLAGRHVVVSAGRHPRAPRPGALPRQPVLRPAGLRAGRDRPGTRRRGHSGRRQRRAPGPRRGQGGAGGVRRRAAGRRARGRRRRGRGGDGGRGRRLPAAGHVGDQDQEG
jgi:3-polyprenyl-4-hydroxybenzoate decarboxylase